IGDAPGMWMSPDPLSEEFPSYSPYNFCFNNPMRYTDPDGMAPDDWRINFTDKNGNQQQFVFNGGATALPDNQFVRDFVSAYRYDVGNGGGDGLRSVAENPALMIDVQQTSSPSFTDQPSSSPGSGDYNVVNWNPKMGLETTNGTIMSPATVLDHEADHAGKYAAAGKVSMNSRVETPDKKYDNKEEKRVITGSEQRTARANGEVSAGRVTRTDHKGLPVITTSPTSNKVDAAKTVKFNDNLNSQGMYPTPSADKYRKN
ncbi:TPA: M91 family zinc metallopeptidase, partial [Flavobacterium psychrophilum]